MSEIIRYEQVDISYDGRRVVHDISFAVEEREILGIAGESGSGKSTLLKAAMGLLGPDGLVTRGDIWYKGRDLPDLSEVWYRRHCHRLCCRRSPPAEVGKVCRECARCSAARRPARHDRLARDDEVRRMAASRDLDPALVVGGEDVLPFGAFAIDLHERIFSSGCPYGEWGLRISR